MSKRFDQVFHLVFAALPRLLHLLARCFQLRLVSRVALRHLRLVRLRLPPRRRTRLLLHLLQLLLGGFSAPASIAQAYLRALSTEVQPFDMRSRLDAAFFMAKTRNNPRQP